MVEFEMQREVRQGVARFRLQGVFNGQAAFALVQALREERGAVLLDFAKVTRCVDFGLAALATELRAPEVAGLKVELQGLSGHQRRLMHYFGLELDRDATPVNDDASADPLVGQVAMVPA